MQQVPARATTCGWGGPGGSVLCGRGGRCQDVEIVARDRPTGDIVEQRLRAAGALGGAAVPLPRDRRGGRGWRGSVRPGRGASRTSSASADPGGGACSSSRATTAIVPSGVPSSWAAAAAERAERGKAGARATKRAGWRLSPPTCEPIPTRDAPGIDGGEADADHQRRPDARLIKLLADTAISFAGQGSGLCKTNGDRHDRGEGDEGQDQGVA